MAFDISRCHSNVDHHYISHLDSDVLFRRTAEKRYLNLSIFGGRRHFVRFDSTTTTTRQQQSTINENTHKTRITYIRMPQQSTEINPVWWMDFNTRHLSMSSPCTPQTIALHSPHANLAIGNSFAHINIQHYIMSSNEVTLWGCLFVLFSSEVD